MEKETDIKNKNTDVANKKTTAKTTTKKATPKKSNTSNKTKTTTKTTKKTTTKSSGTANKTKSTVKAKKTDSKTSNKVIAKNVPVQKKTVSKRKETPKKESVNKLESEEEANLIAQVEEVSEQAQIYEDLLEHNLIDENGEEVSEELIDPKVFRDNELETIKKELKNSKKSNKLKGDKQQKYSEIFKNSLIFIFMELYFLILLISKSTINTIEYITDLKVFVLIELVVSIILFEISYKKENSKIAWHGIEMVSLGAVTILIIDLYSRQSDIIDMVFAFIAAFIILYYIIKMFVIALKKQK